MTPEDREAFAREVIERALGSLERIAASQERSTAALEVIVANLHGIGERLESIDLAIGAISEGDR